MLFTIDGQQSFTRETALAILLEHAAIREIARVFHQYVVHIFWAEQQYSRILSEVDRCCVAVCTLHLLKKAKRVLSQREEVSEIGQSSGTRRERCFCWMYILRGRCHLFLFSFLGACSNTYHYVS